MGGKNELNVYVKAIPRQNKNIWCKVTDFSKSALKDLIILKSLSGKINKTVFKNFFISCIKKLFIICVS